MNCRLIDIAESAAKKLHCACRKIDQSEILINLNEENSDYELAVISNTDCDVLYFSCDIKLCVPKDKYSLLMEAVIKVNEYIAVGHFDIASKNSKIFYSFTIPFISSFSIDESIVESIIQMISCECKKFSNYFLMILENDAINDFVTNAFFLDTVGEA